MREDIFASYLRKLTGEDSSASSPASGELMFDLAVCGGKVVIPDGGVLETDVYVRDGKIALLGSGGSLPAQRTIDARGKYVLPGIIDPHSHMGLFVPLEEDLASETMSAVMGGVTTIGCFLGGQQSHLETFPAIADKVARFSYVDMIPHLVIGNEQQRSEMRLYMDRFGVRSFKLYMNGIPGMIPDVDDGFVLDVFDEIKKSGYHCPVCVHAENRDLVRRATRIGQGMNPQAAVEDYSDTHPVMAEEEAVMRMSYLAEKSGVPVYFVHITSADAVRRLAAIKNQNKLVHVETTSMYLSVCRADERGRNEFKMDPPFRDEKDVEALWQALADGVIDTVGTDNTTITRAEKKADGNMWEAIPGYPAEETHLPALLSEGVIRRGLPLEKLITHITKKPAQIFGVYPQKGTLLPGSDADMVIVDLNKSVTVHAKDLHSRSDFSVFEGRELTGWPVATIKNGRILAENGRFLAPAPEGKLLLDFSPLSK